MGSIGGIGVLGAFVAGLASFLSPCVFPLVPGYLSYLAGTAGQGPVAAGRRRWHVAGHALAFVLGFTLIFVLLGAGATALGQTLLQHNALVRQVAGGVIILFGLAMALAYLLPGLPGISWIYRERRAEVRLGRVSFARSGLIGLAFGAGWTPCVGPLLGSIITLAAVNSTLGQGIALLTVYALGLGVPFLLMGVLIDRVAGLVKRINRYTGPLSVAGGILLVVVGGLMVTNALAGLARFAPVLGGA